jgi:UDP-N-acetylglucosamine--N-acetylmuramyl-(pentapeptide) pyrophosphoryl-undecaprenol N-acetylglucosamine transferase
VGRGGVVNRRVGSRVEFRGRVGHPVSPTVVVFSGGGTGGHLYPALALMEALSSLRPDVRPFFVGAQRGLEAEVVPQRGLDHLLLPIQGLRRGAVWQNLGVLVGLLRSLAATGEAFTRIRPRMVVVTGGYAAGPAGIMAGLMGIPLALQEQNSLPGTTSRMLSRWSRQVHLAFPEARGHLPRRVQARVRVSGNPVRTSTPMSPTEAKAHFGIDADSRVVLVVGGSQGAEGVNRAVLDAIQGVVDGGLSLPKGVHLLWATGPHKLEEVETRLRAIGRPAWVQVVGYLHDVPQALSAATLAVSRAGAMTTSEFLAWGVPALLVPLPSAAADHQTRNAESLADAGVALHLPESELTGGSLWNAVTALLDDAEALEAMATTARERGRPEASREIAEALVLLLPECKALEGRVAS